MVKLKASSFIISAFILCGVTTEDSNGIENEGLQVELKQGLLVSGKPLTTLGKQDVYYAFKGVPYAEPPVGELRFKPPVPHTGWDKILHAKKDPPVCPQLNNVITNHEEGLAGHEDCLYLNVYTPKTTGGDKLPVIVSINNKFFRTTHRFSRQYNPDYFIEERVITVFINYRLSVLGYLNLEEESYSGNMGLKDIILALEWVRDNIEHFGGDASRVTLMGSSSGGVAVDMLIHSQRAKGLFSAAIIQSETSWSSNYFPGEPKKRAYLLSETLNITSKATNPLIGELSKKTVRDLLYYENRALEADEGKEVQHGILPFSPSVDIEYSSDPIIASKPEDSTTDISIPILIGYNSREGLELGAYYLAKPQFLTYAERDFIFQLPIRTSFRFKLEENIYRAAIQEIKDFYFEDGRVKTTNVSEYITYIGDVMKIYHTDYTVRQYSLKSKHPVYYYKFGYSGTLNKNKRRVLSKSTTFDGVWGASAEDELCYLLLCTEIQETYEKLHSQEQPSNELAVLSKMVRLWTNFAKTGNPTPSENDDILEGLVWEPATTDAKKYLDIGVKLTLGVNPNDDTIQFWDQFLDKYEAMAIDGVVKDAVKDEL